MIFISRENTNGYLSADTICSEERTFFRERRSRKTVSLEKQILYEISKLAPNGGYFVYFLRTIFIFNARDFSVEFLSFSVLWHNFIQQINISLPLQQ